MKKPLIILLCLGFLCSYVSLAIDATAQESQEIDGLYNTLDILDQKLEKPLSDDERAKVLYERSYIMLTTFPDKYLKEGTLSLLEAIKLIPRENGNKEFLYEVYEALWKDKQFSDDEAGKEMQEVKEKARVVVEEYMAGRKDN